MSEIWRGPQARKHCGKTRSPWYDDIARGLMTRPVKLSRRAVGWPAEECKAINAARIAGLSEAEIRALVDKLHAKRQEVAQ
jgi:prophage regulatory protein